MCLCYFIDESHHVEYHRRYLSELQFYLFVNIGLLQIKIAETENIEIQYILCRAYKYLGDATLFTLYNKNLHIIT